MISRPERALRSVALVALVNASGCATIVSGTTDKLKIDSTPSGATVTVDAVERGQTPLELDLKRGTPHIIVFKKSGYEDNTVVTTNTLNGWLLGNILLGGLIGLIVDFSTDAGNDISPNHVTQALTPAASKLPTSNTASPQSDTTNPLPKWIAPTNDYPQPTTPDSGKRQHE